MLISQLEAIPSPSNKIQLSARVTYKGRGTASEVVWFEFNEGLLEQTSRSGDPWLLALLPFAFVSHQPLQIELALDPILLNNVRHLMAIWSRWYPEFSPIPIEASREDQSPEAPSRSAVFFSGGVDSFFTVLNQRAHKDHPIDDLLFVHGADIPIRETGGFARAKASIAFASQAWNMRLLTVGTNLRSTRFRLADWGQLSHGALLGAVGLLFEGRYRQIYISSSWPQGVLPPYGSHPDTDPLMSTSHTAFVHYGVWANRIQKITSISSEPIALDNLRVCWKNVDGSNCGRCTKCLRTMAVLEILGKLEACTAFPSNQLDLNRLRNAPLGNDWQHYSFLGPFAREHGRTDIAEAFEAARSRAARRDHLVLFGMVQRAAMRLRRSAKARQWLLPPLRWLRRVVSHTKDTRLAADPRSAD